MLISIPVALGYSTVVTAMETDNSLSQTPSFTNQTYVTTRALTVRFYAHSLLLFCEDIARQSLEI